MSVRAMTWAFEQPLAGNHKVILLVLADHHDDERGICFPSVGRIAQRAHISESTVVRCLRDLETAGYLTRQERFTPEGRQMSTLYALQVAVDVHRRPPLPVDVGGGCQIDRAVTADTPEGVTADTPYEPSKEPSIEKKTRARGTRLPEGWVPSSEAFYRARERMPAEDIEQELVKFTNYWMAKAGREAVKIDWDRTFDNWIINAAERRPTNGRDHQPTRDTAEARRRREIYEAHLRPRSGQ